MRLDHERGAAAGQPVDQGHLPQRTVVVELVHLGEARHLEDFCQGARRGRRHPMDVVAQVEVRVVDPARRRWPQGRHHPLPEHRQGASDPVQPVQQHVPPWRSVQHDDGHYRRAQPGVRLHPVCESVCVAHEVDHVVRPSPSLHARKRGTGRGGGEGPVRSRPGPRAPGPARSPDPGSPGPRPPSSPS